MAGKNTLIKSFFNDRGIDLRSSDLVREPSYASDSLNVDYRKTGALNKRKGYQAKAEDIGGGGVGIYANINTTSGAIVEELVTLDSNLHKLVTNTLTVTYSGSTTGKISIYLDSSTSTFKLVLTEALTDVLTYDLGIGINETTPITIADVETQITAITGFSATGSGNTGSPAAFLDISRDIAVATTGTDITYTTFTEINCPLANPFATTQTNKNDSEFQVASMVNLSNILYVSTGYDELYKYDSQTFYRAGLPKPTQPTAALGGAGTLTDATGVTHIITYIQKDAKGNYVESIESTASTPALTPTSQSINVTVPNVLNTTGFNTGCGVVAGLQATTNTITVDDGSGGANTFSIGDTAYFYDSVSADYIERDITGRSATTITISGAAVTVADNAVISNNLRIAIYRNVANGAIYSLVAEIPNDSFSANQIYNDDTATLSADYVAPIKEHGLPPKGKYLSVFRNTLISAGDITNINAVSYSTSDGPEYFPAGDNQFLVETERGDKITGLAVNNNALFTFKDKSIHALTGGDLQTVSYRVDEVASGDVGCVSHHSIEEVRGKLMFLSTKGVYGLTIGDNEPEEVSYKIEPLFRDVASEFNFKKAIALNWFQKDKYILMFTAESETAGGAKYTNTTTSKILVYDYARKAWLPWNKMDIQGGAVILNDSLYFAERRLGSLSGNVESYIYKVQDTDDTYDYADHNAAIEWEHKTHWESMGEPDIYKKFLRLKLHSLDASINNFETEAFGIDVEAQINYNDSESCSFSLDYGSDSGWGDFEWGIAPWGSARTIQLKSKLKNTKAQAIRVIYSNNVVHENILISGWTFEANVPFRARVKE